MGAGTGRTRALALDPWVIAAVAAALLLRLINLDLAALWHDEVETALWSRLTPPQVFETVFARAAFYRYDPYHLPLYFLLVNGWTALVGESVWLLRLPGVLCAVVAVALTAAIGERLIERAGARWAAWLAALSPFLLHHAQEARMYALTVMLAAASLLLLLRYLDGAARRLGVGFAMCNLALLLTHYYTVFFVATLLGLLVLLRPRAWRGWLAAAAATALGLLGVLYLALVLTDQRSGEIYDLNLPLVLSGSLWSLLYGYVLLPGSEQLHAQGADAVWPYLPYVLAAALPLAVVGPSGLAALSWRARLLLLAPLGGCVLGPFAAYLLFPLVSINPRYLAPGLPALLVLLAAGAAVPRQRALATLRVAAGAALLGAFVLIDAAHLRDPGQKREDVYAAGNWLDARVAAAAEILITSREMESLALFHWPHRRLTLYPAHGVQARADNAAELLAALPLTGDGPFYYVFGRAWLSDPDGALRALLAERYARCEGAEFRGVQILCFQSRGD